MRGQPEIIVVRTKDGLDDVFARLQKGTLGVDTETSGLKWWKERVGAINLAAGNVAVCAIQDALGPAARYLSHQVKHRRSLAFHNAKFDMHHLRATFGLHIPYIVHDTAVESFLVDNRGANAFGWRTKAKHSLKPLSEVYLDPNAQDHEKDMMAAIKRRGGKDKGDWAILLNTEDEHLFTKYSALDPWYTLELHKQFFRRIIHWTQPSSKYPSLQSVYEREQWMILALRDMEERGICASHKFLDDWRVQLGGQDGRGGELGKCFETLAKATKGARLARDINWNSVPQVQALLYKRRPDGGLGLGGGPGTDAVTLLNLAHPVGAALIKYRETFKQWSSYANSLLEALTPQGTIHCSFRSSGADTHRTSCAEPNLQQQTRISGVRKAYHPRKGLEFRFADYEQVEMRFAGHFANEPFLINGFNNVPDFDPHKALAVQMFGKLFDPKSQHRKYAKITNFTKLFGGGEGKVTEQLINLVEEQEAIEGCRVMKASIEPGISPWRALARAVIERANTLMPGLPRTIRETAAQAESRGFMMNAFGAHRFFDDGDERWYAAFNTLVQGTAGIKAKEGLVAVYRERQLLHGDLACLLLIHDEIVYETEGDPKTDAAVLELMEDHTSYKVPITADINAGPKNWQDKVKLKIKRRKAA